MKAGYKQTEVGVIPEDWDVIPLGKCASVGSGGTPSRNNLAYWGGDIPWITTTQIDGTEITETHERITDLGLSKSAAKIYPKGTLLMAMYGQGKTRGKVGIMGIRASINQACAAIQIETGVVPDFILHYLNFSYEKIRELSNSGGQENLSSGIVKALLTPLPPTLDEQKAIAGALSDVDGLIAGLEALIAKKRSLKTATMQQLLTGKTRLPGFGEGVGMKQTELGEIPEDWDAVALGTIGAPVIGLTYKPSDVSEDGILVLRSSNIQKENLSYENNVFVKHELPDRVITKEGDLLICVRNGSRSLIGKCALIDETAAGSAFGAFMSLFKSDFSQFIYFQFKSRIIKKQIEDTMGATINQITNKDLKRFCIPFPPTDDERSAIMNVLNDSEAEIRVIEGRLAKAKALKQGMMQELLTGRTRLI